MSAPVSLGRLESVDLALQRTAQLAADGKISLLEEKTAVKLALNAHVPTLLLAKHFGALPSFETHLKKVLNTLKDTDFSTLSRGAMFETLNPHSQPSFPPSQPPSSPHAAHALFLRRSVVNYNATRVPAEIIHRALTAAVLAPNHFLTEPWRFYDCGEETRQKLLKLNPRKEKIFSQVPGWLIVSVESDDPTLNTKKGLEDYAATACATNNFMISLAADGVGSKWMTGALGVPPEKVLEAVGANTTAERLVGAIWYGYPKDPIWSPRSADGLRKKSVAGVLKTLP